MNDLDALKLEVQRRLAEKRAKQPPPKSKPELPKKPKKNPRRKK